MSRFWKIALPVVLVVVAAGFAGWWFFLRDDAPPEARLVTRDAPATTTAITTDPTTGTTIGTTAGGATGAGTTAAPAGASPAGTWTVQQGDEVFAGYRVTEQFAGETIEKTAVGRSRAVSGTVVVTAAGQGATISEASVEVDMAQLTSDSDRRDNRLRGDGLETDEFPTATFELTQTIELAAAPELGVPFDVQATGNLTLHGVTKEVTIPLSVRWSGEFIDVAGQLPIVLGDFQINPPNVGGFVSVAEDGILELQLSFVPA
jgi:polyisoprenoid-binding protein YceI